MRPMRTLDLAVQAATMKTWPYKREGNTVKIEVPTTGSRTQVVNVEMGTDGDGDAAAFLWSKFADARAVSEPWSLLRKNTELTYGKVAERNSEIIILHALYDETASLADVGKAIFWIAKNADELESSIYGTDTQ